MMLDLYQDAIAENLQQLKPVQDVEPGIWANFASGAAQTAMQGFAKAGRAASMALAPIALAEDAYYGTTTASERYFKWHDETFGRAVDYWTPKPNEVGVAGEVTGNLLSMLPMVIANPSAAVIASQLGTAEDLVRRYPELSATKANVVGAIQGAGLGLGIWMPILGQTLAQRVLVGGAGFNVAQGVAMRALSGAVLGDTKAAEEFKAFDGKALTLDVLLGLAFGMGAHILPGQREQGAAAWKRIEDWAKGLKPSEIDALMVLREAQHINEDSLPGKPVTGADVSAHVDRVRTAIDQVLRDEPVSVQNIGVSRGTSPEIPVESKADVGVPQVDAQGRVEPTFSASETREPLYTADTTRLAEAERQVGELQRDAELIRQQEGLPRIETPETRPPADITPLAPEAQARAVGQHIERQLIETGMQRDEAVANAAIWEAFAKSAHERYGVTPAELMTKWGVDVRRMDSADRLLGPLENRYEQITPESAAELKMQTKLPADPLFAEAVGNTPAAKITDKGLLIDLVRYQKPEQEGAQSVRTGVFYLPAGAATQKFYRSGKNGYGGSEKFEAPTLLRAPIFVKGATGGRAPELAYDQIKGKGAYQAMRADVLRDATGWNKSHEQKIDSVKSVLEKYGADPSLAYKIVDASREGNTLPYAVQENIVAHAVRRAGYDSVLGYSKGKSGVFLSEIFDVRELTYPARGIESQVHDTFFQSEKSRWYSELGRQIDGLKTASAPAQGWKDTIKGLVGKGVVKQAELEATGLNDWLDLQQGKVTKQQVQDFIVQNGVRVEEVELGGGTKHFTIDDFHARGVEQDEAEAGMVQNFSVNVPRTLADRIEYLDVSVYKSDDPTGIKSFDINDSGNVRFSDRANSLNEIMRSVERYLTDNYGIEFSGDYGDAPASKFSQYQLPGGENYRELLLTLPGAGDRHLGNGIRILGKDDFRSSHFDTPNILAHVRFNERTDADGKRVLFLEEIQSDWAQKGKREGFKSDIAPVGDPKDYTIRTDEHQYHVTDPVSGRTVSIGKGTVGSEAEAREYAKRYFDSLARDQDGSEYAKVPRAPFVGKTEAWVGLTLKRMIRYAAENGFDRVAWTNGEQQVSRYTSALRKQVDSIEWKKTDKGVQLIGWKGKRLETVPKPEPLTELPDGYDVISDRNNPPDRRYGITPPGQIHARFMGAGHPTPAAAQAEALRLINNERLAHWAADAEKAQRQKVVDTTEKESVLSDAIGKSMADKIRNDPNQSGVIEGDNIKIDDTGMATFYDRIVPNVANDVLKKLGGERVKPINFQSEKSVSDGWRISENEDGLWEVYNPRGEIVEVEMSQSDAAATMEQFAREDAEAGVARTGWEVVDTSTGIEKAVGQQRGFDITPELRDKAMAGMPLFQGGARGAVNFDVGKTLIGLFEKADKSTFQHETGHVFLEMTKDLASRPDAPVAAAQDWATIANWLKIEGGEITREAHEQWARGWEKYLAEGVAPNEGLKGAFKRFRDWLIDIYKSLTNIDAPLNNQIRGVMARMLESQAKDPVAKGGLEDPRLQEPEYRTALDMMARESGWAEEGGRITRDPMTGEVNARTVWVPHAEWYQRMQQDPNANLAGGRRAVEEAVRKAVMGEKMSAQEKRSVTWMLDEHRMLLDHWRESGAEAANPQGDPFEYSNAMHAEGIEQTDQNLLDMALIDRARQLDPQALENIPDNFDDLQYMQAVREIINAKQTNQTDTARAQAGAAETGQVAPQAPVGNANIPPPLGGAGETPGAAAASTEARRVAAENPQIRVNVGTDELGQPIYKTLNQMLDDAAEEAALARDDVRLITAAAECLLGVA